MAKQKKPAPKKPARPKKPAKAKTPAAQKAASRSKPSPKRKPAPRAKASSASPTSAWLSGPYAKAVGKAPERKKSFRTTSGGTLQPVYAPSDVAPGLDARLGFPGDYPFTRGVQPTMYRGRFWTMRQYAGFGTAEESNKRYRYLLQSGQTGPLGGLRPAHADGARLRPPPRARRGGQGGRGHRLPRRHVDAPRPDPARQGLHVDDHQLDGVDPARPLPGGGREAGRGRRPTCRAPSRTTSSRSTSARGTYVYPPRPSIRIITDIFAYTAKFLPKWNTISISGYHIREAGSTAVQEVAFTLADGISYVEAAERAGLDVDAFAGRLSFFFNAHNNVLEEVAKFRAARRLWARIMKERFKARDPRSWMLRFHTQTAGSMLTAQQPENNVVRVTLQALSAVLGGTQSLHTNSRDEALGLPTESSALLALRTQQIIANESGVADVIDPLGGSWAIEAMTDEIEGKASEYIEKIDAMGGMVEAIDKGFVQREIQDAAYAWQRQVEDKELVVVGVNAYKTAEPPVTVMRVDPALEAAQVARLKAFRAARDGTAAKQAVDAVRAGARGTENLMPLILAAVKAHATLGEISDAMRDVFGEYRETVVV